MKRSSIIGFAAVLLGVAACQPNNAVQPTQEQVPVATSSTSLSSKTTKATASGLVTGFSVLDKPSGARASLALQQEILQYLNDARSRSCKCGNTTYYPAPSLRLNDKLNASSDKHALDMATYNYFSHTGRDGSQPWDRMTREGYVWQAAGENIAAGYATARAVVDGWMQSPGHCANIMNAGFQEVGVGYAYDANSTYKTYWVNNFGSPQSSGEKSSRQRQ